MAKRKKKIQNEFKFFTDNDFLESINDFKKNLSNISDWLDNFAHNLDDQISKNINEIIENYVQEKYDKLSSEIDEINQDNYAQMEPKFNKIYETLQALISFMKDNYVDNFKILSKKNISSLEEIKKDIINQMKDFENKAA